MSLRSCFKCIPFCFSLVAFFILLSPAVSSSATSHNRTKEQVYTVKKGDTLYKISKKFDVGVDTIKSANNLKSKSIRPGAKLTIPGRAPVKQHDSQYHVVKKGETLSSISKRYSIPVKDLKELNALGKIGSNAKLKQGRQLIVKKAGPKSYIVRKGDTVAKIAKKFGADPDELVAINELESDELKSGQTILLEPPVLEEQEQAPRLAVNAKVSVDIDELIKSQEVESIGLKERVILFAKKMLNIPYRFGGSSFLGIDCSGYVQKVFGLLHMALPRTAREQFAVGESVEKEDLSIGDLVFFRTYASFPSHVGIYLGNNLFIHASSRSKKVSIDSLETPYYFKRFIGAKRLLQDELKADEDQTITMSN